MKDQKNSTDADYGWTSKIPWFTDVNMFLNVLNRLLLFSFKYYSQGSIWDSVHIWYAYVYVFMMRPDNSEGVIRSNVGYLHFKEIWFWRSLWTIIPLTKIYSLLSFISYVRVDIPKPNISFFTIPLLAWYNWLIAPQDFKFHHWLRVYRVDRSVFTTMSNIFDETLYEQFHKRCLKRSWTISAKLFNL